MRHRGDRVRGALNFFVYDIDNFIFGDRSDEVADNLPVFNILQGDSRFRGFDARGSTRLAGQTWLTLGLGYVDARLTTGEALPRIPPLRGTVDLDIPYGGFTLTPQLEFAARASLTAHRERGGTVGPAPGRDRVCDYAEPSCSMWSQSSRLST